MSHYVLTTSNFKTEVWLQFWTEANERSSGVNSKLYLGIYGLLTGLSIIFVWVTIWYVLSSRLILFLIVEDADFGQGFGLLWWCQFLLRICT